MPMRIISSILWSTILVLSCGRSECAATSLNGEHLFAPVCGTSETHEWTVVHPIDNRFYWICSNGTASLIQCSAGERFNAKSGSCDDDGTVPSFRGFQADLTLTEMEFECPPQGIHRFVLEGSCRDYHLCIGGQHSIRSCVDELHFDEELRNCNFIQSARCTRDWCPKADSGDGRLITFPSTEHCNQFLVCNNGNLQTFQCIGDLHWNQAIQDCDYAGNAACNVITSTPTQPPTTTEPAPPKCPIGPGVHTIPHPSDCQRFYLCVGDEIPYPRECPDDLEFDPDFGECNRPENVQCAHRD